MRVRCRLCIRARRKTSGFKLTGRTKIVDRHGHRRNVELTETICNTCGHSGWRMA